VGLFNAQVDADGVVWLSGDLDLAVTSQLENAARAALNGQRELVLDLSNLEFMDSSGLCAVLQTARQMDRGIVLRRPPRTVRRLIEIMGIEGRFGIRVEE